MREGSFDPLVSRMSDRVSWDRPHRLYIWLGLLFGILFVCITPPFQVPDEPNHFYRAYQIAQGQLFAERRADGAGGELPASLVQTVEVLLDDIPFHPENKADPAAIRAAFRTPLDRSKKAFVPFSNTAIYSFIPYLPQALALTIAQQLNLSPLWSLYLGRLVNLLVTLLLIGGAIRVTPIFKRGFLLIGLVPMTVYEMASVSPDAFTNGVALLFIAHVLDLAFRAQRRITPGAVSLLMILGALLSASKSAYFPLVFLVLLIPLRKADTRRSYLVACALVILAGVSSFLFWTHNASETFVRFYSGGYSSFSDALRSIIEHPIGFARKIIGNFYYYGLFYLHSFVGILGWLDTPLPVPFAVLYLLAISACVILDPAWPKIGRWQYLIIAGVAAAGVVLIVASQFFLWTRVSAGSINRAQGRYFIPVAPLIFLLLGNVRLPWRAPESALAWISARLPVGSLLLALIWVVARYYGVAF